MKKGPAKPKKSKEVEKAKPEEKAPEAPAENGEAKAEDDVRAMKSYINMQNKGLVLGEKALDTTFCLTGTSYRRS